MALRRLTAAIIAATLSGSAFAADMPGVTPTSVKVGTIAPFSGPASPISNVSKAMIAYISLLNERGGVNGRKIDLIANDDAYSPPKSVEQVRKLIESDEVAFMFGQLGTPGISATVKYVNTKKVPDILVMSGLRKFTDFKDLPLTTTGMVSYDAEARVYAKYVESVLPEGKIAVLYQNDDLGKGYLKGFTEALKDKSRVVAASFESTDPTVDSQIATLKASGAEALMIASIPKVSAQALRKRNDMGWKPLTVVTIGASSVSAALQPVGLDKVVGVVTSGYFKDPNDPAWANDQGMLDYKKFLEKYLPTADFADLQYLAGYQNGMILEHLLKQCGDDLSRENIAKQARAIKDLKLPTALPGVLANTDADNNQVWTQLRLLKWTGKGWESFGDVKDARLPPE